MNRSCLAQLVQSEGGLNVGHVVLYSQARRPRQRELFGMISASKHPGSSRASGTRAAFFERGSTGVPYRLPPSKDSYWRRN